MAEEEQLQRIHELKVALIHEKNINIENTEEIERLRAEKNEAQAFEASSKAHEAECRRLKEAIQESEARNLTLSQKVEELEAVIVENKKALLTIQPVPDVHDSEPIINELEKEKELHDRLKEKYNDLAEENKEKSTTMKELKSTLEHVLKELDETRELLALKKSGLAEAKEALRELQEENLTMHAKMESMKCNPQSELSRGNSVFKEVEDNRKIIVEAYNDLKGKYREMKGVITSQNNTISCLKAENSSLQYDNQRKKQDARSYCERVTTRMQGRIDELEALVVVLEKRKESPEIITISENNLSQLGWVNGLINEARKETRQAIANFQKCTSESYKRDMNLVYEAQRQKEQLQTECLDLQQLNKDLNLKIESLENELKLFRCGDGIKGELPPTSTNPSNKTVRFADDNLEETACGLANAEMDITK